MTAAIPGFAPLEASYWLARPMMRGEQVWQAQLLLNARAGAGLAADGLYGAATAAALRGFQRRRGLVEDGVLGPVSWAALHGVPLAQAGLPRGLEAILDAPALAALRRPHARYPDAAPWWLAEDGIAQQGRDHRPDAAEARLAATLLARHAEAIATAATRFPVPVELVLATIGTESAGDARAFRAEPGCDAADPARTPHRVSAGLMQTLLSTAREALGDPAITLDALCNPSLSIRAGMAVIWRQAPATRLDPPLVACAYNAGSLRYEASAGNAWRLVQYPLGTGRHADRFCRALAAALEAVRRAGPAALPPGTPSLVALLAAAAPSAAPSA